MTDKIIELAKQARLPLVHDRYMTESQVEFASLIIQECAYIARLCPVVNAAQGEDVAQHIEKCFSKFLKSQNY